LLALLLGNNGQQGTITRKQLADLLEVEEVLVGQGWVNTAKPGQTPSFVRVWGKHAASLNRNRFANTQSGATFGFTAQYQGRIAGQLPNPKLGLRGGVEVIAPLKLSKSWLLPKILATSLKMQLLIRFAQG